MQLPAMRVGKGVGWLRHFLQLLVTETDGHSYWLAKQELFKIV
jgi:hypothetical protein